MSQNIILYFLLLNFPQSSILSNVLTSDYDPKGIPKASGNPLIVSIELYTDDINSIDEKDMEFRLDFYLRHRWNVSNPFCELYKQSLGKSNIRLNSSEDSAVLSKIDFSKSFWVPDTFLTNAKREKIQSKVVDTRVLKIRYQNNSCQMEDISRLMAIVGCPMDFHEYPFEQTVCRLEFRSYLYRIDSILYEWQQNVNPVNPKLRLLEHDLIITNGNGFTFTFDDKFSVVYMNLTFKRRILNKLTQVYAPSFLIVGLSWLSFWISLEAIPGRVILCVTSLLALITQFVSVRRELPQVSYINVCMMSIFGSLLEFTIVKFIQRRKKLMELLLDSETDTILMKDDFLLNQIEFYYTSPKYPFVPGISDYTFDIIRKGMSVFYNSKVHSINGIERNQESNKMELRSNSCRKSIDNSGPLKKILLNKQNHLHLSQERLKCMEEIDENEVVLHILIDKISRILFPICFCFFNLIYWTILLTK